MPSSHFLRSVGSVAASSGPGLFKTLTESYSDLEVNVYVRNGSQQSYSSSNKYRIERGNSSHGRHFNPWKRAR